MTTSSYSTGFRITPSQGLLITAVLILFFIAPFFLSTYLIRVLQFFFFSVGLAMSWNILGGFTGYWSFGHTVFIGLGAFTAGKLSPVLGGGSGEIWILLVYMAAGCITSSLLALLLAYPLLRLRGIYYAIAMLAAAEFTSELSSNLDVIGGAMGLMVPEVTPEKIDPAILYYYVFLILAFLIIIAAARMKNSRFGYGLASIREGEDTAKMLGVPTEKYKVMASVVSGGLVGTLGVIYGFSLGYFTTHSVFRVDFSLYMILYCLIGGLGTLVGPILGAGIMVFLNQVVLGKVLHVHLLITGILVIVIVLLAPSGIIGSINAWKEKGRGLMSKAEN